MTRPILLALAAIAASLSAPSRAADVAALEFSRVVMGGRLRIVVHPADGTAALRESATAAVQAAFERVDALEAALSDWRQGSELSRLNASAGAGAVEVGADLHAALERSLRIAEDTDGAFDPTVGPLSLLWRQARSTGSLPAAETIADARALVGWRGVEVLPASAGQPSRARLQKAGMRLDLGGIGKGIAVDEASRVLDARLFRRHLVDFGSTLRAGDAPPAQEAWIVEAPGFGTIALCRSALAVSGDDEQAIEIDGTRASHIVDPRPGREGLGLDTPVRAAVVAQEATLADALATALCVVGPRGALPIADRFGRCAMSVEVAGDGKRRDRFSTPSFRESGQRCGDPVALHPLRRLHLPGNRAVLEVAAQRYVKEGQPTITLVGVTHIGTPELYAALQRFFQTQDVVLYESVMPAGIAGPAGAAPAERRERTEESMAVVADVLEGLRVRTRELPGALADIPQAAHGVDTRFVRLLPPLLRDGWGNELLYEPRFDDQGAPVDFELRSLGADGARGGKGADADIVVTRPAESALADDGLQADLADALGLRFQLRAIDYSKPNFRFADMTMPDLGAALKARGLDDGGLLGTLAGTSFPARMAKILLTMLKLADGLMGGAMREMIKAVLMELFAEGEILEAATDQMGKGFMEVIVDERNAVALAGLRDVAPDAAVAIFYGAAHLPDLAERLEADGYRLEEVTWFPAFEVDLAKAGLDRRQLELLREEIRASLRAATR